MSRGGDDMDSDDLGAMDFDDRVERFVTGRMDPGSAQRFEERLLHDSELLAETRAAAALQDGLRGLADREEIHGDEQQGSGLAIAAVLALSVTVSLLMGRGIGPEVGLDTGVRSMVVELALTRGGAGPIVHLARSTTRLELKLYVPGVTLAERAWRLDGTPLGGIVRPGLEGAAPSIVLDAAALADGDYRLVVTDTEVGDLSFGFTITH